MMLSRTFKFAERESLVNFVKNEDPPVRKWDADKLTVRITLEGKAAAARMEAAIKQWGGVPMEDEWEEKWS